MLMSAVLDPSAFDKDCFDDLYAIHAEDFLRGIWRNGVLIVDSERRLQEELFKKAESLSGTGKGKRLQILLTDLLKDKSKRVAVPSVSLNNASLADLLDLTCALKKDTEPDGLIVADENFEKLRFDPEHRHGVVPLSEYRDSDFEKERQGYCDGLGQIDALSKSVVKDIVGHLVRFSKRLRFYDPYIGTGKNTSGFRRGIEYILSIWEERGFFASQQGIGEVEIYTCAEHVPNDEMDDVKRKINRVLMDRLKERFPDWWQIKLFVKEDPDSIFHARYLETQHVIIRVDRGFDIFKQNDEFWRNFFTLNMAESSHLRECRELPNAD